MLFRNGPSARENKNTGIKGGNQMSRFTLDDLYGQRITLVNAISDQQAKKDDLVAKVQRLQKASDYLGSNINLIEASHQRVVNVTIDQSRWRGTEKDKFDSQKNAYETSIKSFATDTKRARDQIDAKKSELETNIASIDSTISHFKATLTNVNNQIDARRNG